MGSFVYFSMQLRPRTDSVLIKEDFLIKVCPYRGALLHALVTYSLHSH